MILVTFYLNTLRYIISCLVRMNNIGYRLYVKFIFIAYLQLHTVNQRTVKPCVFNSSLCLIQKFNHCYIVRYIKLLEFVSNPAKNQTVKA